MLGKRSFLLEIVPRLNYLNEQNKSTCSRLTRYPTLLRRYLRDSSDLKALKTKTKQVGKQKRQNKTTPNISFHDDLPFPRRLSAILSLFCLFVD